MNPKRLQARIMFVALLCLSSHLSLLNAQSLKLVSGIVLSSEDHETIVGATVRVKGFPSYGQLTDADGAFKFQIPKEATTLTVSFVGMPRFRKLNWGEKKR